jgi:hypothetical protein
MCAVSTGLQQNGQSPQPGRVFAEFRARDALVEIRAPAGIAGAVGGLLADRSRAAELGRRALACAELKRGATESAISVIREVTADSSPRYRPNLVAFVFRWPVSLAWRTVGALLCARNLGEAGS